MSELAFPANANFKAVDGDWTCPDPACANVNFARRTACNRCGKEKEELSEARKKQIGIEIGKAAAEKSRGLFSPDDWQCAKCGNVNWARRSSCNVCNAPKKGDLEERTGYGGGYNDRGTVEYKEREDSDGEYDEFGRKRKKKTKAEVDQESKVFPPAKQAEPDHEEKDEEEDDEDDDDDDEDGDLSKYDLSGWGDDSDKDDKDDKKDDEKGEEEEGKKDEKKSNSSSSSRRRRSSSRSSSDDSRGRSKRTNKRGGRSSSRSRSRSRSRDRD